MLIANSTKDWGPDANIYKCTCIPNDKQCILIYSTCKSDASTVIRFSCFDTSKSKWRSKIDRDIYLRGLTDFENALRAVGTVTNMYNVECSFDEGFNTSKLDANCVNADNDRHTYWNWPNKLHCQNPCYELFSGSAGQQNALYHCNWVGRDLLAPLCLRGTFLSDLNPKCE